MSKKWIAWILGGLLWLSGLPAWAQVDSLLQQADRLLSYKAYGRAIEAYSQLLSEQADQLTPVQKATVQGQLATAYRQVGDGPKAERYFRDALASTPDPNPQLLLLFAQTLNVEGIARHEMANTLNGLRSAGQPARATIDGLAFLAHGMTAADRALVRERKWHRTGGPLFQHHIDDLRNDIASALHDHRIADPDVLAACTFGGTLNRGALCV